MVTTLPEAMEAKVGLRLERGKISIPIYIVEHAEKPTPN
jgi:uncharacterized protein (TIGR03435 family)